jgi:hypothetical protein
MAGWRDCPNALKAEIAKSGARCEGQLSGSIVKANNRPGAGIEAIRLASEMLPFDGVVAPNSR